MVRAASLHYVENLSRVQIAAELGVSRFKVARLLEQSVAQGIVSIEIGVPGSVDLDLSIALREHFNLRRAIVVITPSTAPEVVQESLGRVGAQLLTEIVEDGDVLGVTAGRTLSHLARHVKQLAHCEVVQLTGVAGPDKENSVEVVRQIARVAGGRGYSIFAPLLVRDAATAQALHGDPVIKETFRRFGSVTKAIVAIGSWDPPDSQLYANASRLGILDDLLAQNVRAEVAATLLDGEGIEVNATSDRSIAISTSQLRAIPDVVGVAGGALKVNAVRSAILSGLITSVVTDARLARRLLATDSH